MVNSDIGKVFLGIIAGNVIGFMLSTLFPSLLVKFWFIGYSLIVLIILAIYARTQKDIFKPIWVFPLAGEGLRITFISEGSYPVEVQWALFCCIIVVYFLIGFANDKDHPRWSITQKTAWIAAVLLIFLAGWALLIVLLFTPLLLFPIISLVLAPMIVTSFGLARSSKRNISSRWTINIMVAIFLGSVIYFQSLNLFGEPPPPQNSSALKVIVDTDMSFDDYLAIYYLLRHPDVEIIAITSVHGVSTVMDGTENIGRLLNHADHEEIPIGQGAEKPRVGDRRFPPLWVGILDAMFRLELPVRQTIETTNASDLIESKLQSNPEAIILALGPLTNIADWLDASPIPHGDIDIWISGGTVELTNPFPDGNRDWNLWVDPQATDLVFSSQANLTVIPLDITHYQLGFGPGLSELISQAPISANRGYRLMDRLTNATIFYGFGADLPIWDAAAAVTLTNPEVCQTWQGFPLYPNQNAGEQDGFLMINPNRPTNTIVCLHGNQNLMHQIWAELVNYRSP